MKSELTQAAEGAPDRDVLAKLAGCASVEGRRHRRAYRRHGSHRYNQNLSERRAESVKAYLAGQSVDRDRIETLGMARPFPRNSVPTSSDSELISCLPNRRAIVSIKGPPGDKKRFKS